MKKTILIIIFGVILYNIAFRTASLLLEQYINYAIGPILPIIIIEQSLIPFVFGFFVYKYLSFSSISSVFIVLIIPVVNFTLSYATATAEEVAINHSGDLLLLLLIVILQPVFIIAGSFVQYGVKNKKLC